MMDLDDHERRLRRLEVHAEATEVIEKHLWKICMVLGVTNLFSVVVIVWKLL